MAFIRHFEKKEIRLTYLKYISMKVKKTAGSDKSKPKEIYLRFMNNLAA